MGRPSSSSGHWVLPPDAFSRGLLGRLERPLSVERAQPRFFLEERPFYLRARALWRRMQRVRLPQWTQRSLERPQEVDGQLEHLCPQFILRNVGRLERAEEEGVPLEVQSVRDHEAEEVLREFRRLRYRPPELLEHMNLEEVVRLRSLLRRLLFEEDWRRRFGRELKERIRGPLFRYDPDAPPETGE